MKMDLNIQGYIRIDTKRVFCNYETLVSKCWLTGWPDARTMVPGDAKHTKTPPLYTYTQNCRPVVDRTRRLQYAPNGNVKPTSIPTSQNCRMGYRFIGTRCKVAQRQRGQALKNVPECRGHLTVAKDLSRSVGSSSVT